MTFAGDLGGGRSLGRMVAGSSGRRRLERSGGFGLLEDLFQRKLAHVGPHPEPEPRLVWLRGRRLTPVLLVLGRRGRLAVRELVLLDLKVVGRHGVRLRMRMGLLHPRVEAVHLVGRSRQPCLLTCHRDCVRPIQKCQTPLVDIFEKKKSDASTHRFGSPDRPACPHTASRPAAARPRAGSDCPCPPSSPTRRSTSAWTPGAHSGRPAGRRRPASWRRWPPRRPPSSPVVVVVGWLRPAGTAGRRRRVGAVGREGTRSGSVERTCPSSAAAVQLGPDARCRCP